MSYQQFFDEKGEPTHAADGDGFVRGGLRKYCYNCSKDITNLIVRQGERAESIQPPPIERTT